MSKLGLVTLAWAATMLPAMAQETTATKGVPDTSRDGPAIVGEGPEAQRADQTIDACWKAWLGKEGLVEGKNERNGDYILVLHASDKVRADPQSKQWLASRNASFETSEIEARQALATSIGSFIRSDRSLAARVFGQETASDTLQQTAKPLSTVEKAEVLTDAALDAEIKKYKPGWNGQDATASEKRQMVMAQRTNLAENIAARSGLYASGAFTPVQCEGIDQDGDYAVLAGLIWSPRLAKVAETIWNVDAAPPPATPKASLNAQFAAFTADNPDWLAYSLGARVFTDDKGERVVVGFGAAPQTTMTSVDVDRARLRALVAVQRFVGEKVEGNDEERSFLQNIETVDGQTLIKDGGSYASTRELYSKALTLNGVVPVQSWRGAHPWSKAKMQVVAVAWSRAWAADSRLVGAAMNKAEQRMRDQGAVPNGGAAGSAVDMGATGAAVPVKSGAQSTTSDF